MFELVQGSFTLGLELGDRQHHVCVRDVAGSWRSSFFSPSISPVTGRRRENEREIRAVSACLSAPVGKNFPFIMQTQDAPAEIMFKLWPWFEANRKRLIIAAVAAVVAFFIWFFITSQRQQNELAAGEAYTKLQLNPTPNPTVQQVADGYLQLANRYSGTLAAQRAQLQAATLYYGAGRYADAQALFQKFLASANGSPLAPGARLGVAASLEAQGKLEAAATEYHSVTTIFPDAAEVIPAKFAQGRVMELQGKLTEASAYYQEVARSPLAGSMASEAAQRIAMIQVKLAAAKPAVKS